MNAVVSQSALRRVRIRIDAQALQHNLSRVKHYAPHSHRMAVIKANGYGHGLLRIAKILHEAELLAVATAAEALELRKQSISQPLVVLHGFCDATELDALASLQVQPVVHQFWQLDLLESFTGKRVDVWLKIDTGMHRLGFSEYDVAAAITRLLHCKRVRNITLISHFSNADEVNNNINNKQLELFNKVISGMGFSVSMANSAAIISLPDSHFDIVRPGIMLYGSSPFASQSAQQLGLQAVMNFESELIAIQRLKQGDAIGYGGDWVCPEDMPVGIVAAGYGDGYPRHAKSATPVWLNGQRCNLLGRVSMDSLCIDLRQVKATPGDRVVLWGKELSVDEVARYADTIAYELLCTAGSMASSS